MKQLDIRIEDDTDNGGRGYRRLTREELFDLVSMALILIPNGARKRYWMHAIEQPHKAIADAICDRLMHYPAFGPARELPAHSCGGGAYRSEDAE